MDALAQLTQLLHALDCLLHLLRLDVLQFVDVEALFLVSFREENDGDPKVLATGRIQTEAWQTVHRAVSHEGVTADGVVDSSPRVCDVLDIGGDNLVAVATDLVRLGFAVAGDERCEVEAFRAFLSVVDDAHAVVGVRLNVSQEREEYTLVVLRAVVEDAEHVSVSCVGR